MNEQIDQSELKNVLKEAVIEALEEKRGLLREIIDEALEDMALARAIDEGLRSERVSAHEVTAVLEGAQ